MLNNKKQILKPGYFGKFGGQFVPEQVKEALNEIVAAYDKYKNDSDFQKELTASLKDYSGRETP